jgi:glycosyltransferase involved in cell wall biosynthesis
MHNLAPEPENLAKMHLVHCGIDVRNFAPPEHKAEDKRPVIAGVGRLVEKKGYSYLIKACRILADQGYDFECLIIGGGPQAALLQQMVQELNLSQHIQLVGAVFQEQLRDYLNRADIFVLPCIVGQDQDMDGIPNTLMEAMAMEIPCISTTISGIPELIVDGKSGLLAPPQDEAALARAIARLLEDRELRSSLGKAGRATVMAEFEIEKNAATLLTIFKSYLGDEAITTTQGGPQNKPIALNYMR